MIASLIPLCQGGIRGVSGVWAGLGGLGCGIRCGGVLCFFSPGVWVGERTSTAGGLLEFEARGFAEFRIRRVDELVLMFV